MRAFPRALFRRSRMIAADSSFCASAPPPISFQAEADSELSLKEGDLVRVHRSGGVGWAVATLLSSEGEPLDGRSKSETEGLVPSGYLRPLRP